MLNHKSHAYWSTSAPMLTLATVTTTWALLAAALQPAKAYSDTVTAQCSSDYQNYCSQHPLGSSALRYCFEANRNSLSQQCINALVDAGEVPRKYLTKDGRK